MKPRLVSLVGRVTTATGVAVALAALLASLSSWGIAVGLVDQAEDRRLSQAARIFLNELDTQHRDGIEKAIEEEQTELAPASIRIAVYEGDRRLGGDDLPGPSVGCVSSERSAVTLRACAESQGSVRVIAAATRASRAPSSFLLGCALASIAAAVAAAVAGRRAARWAVAPLTKLAASLDDVRGDDPTSAGLPDHGNVAEVAALREALAALVGRLGDSLARARRFSADAAHELRTPLTVLSGELDLLRELFEEELPRDADGDAVARLSSLQHRVRVLSRLVERLLVLSTSAKGDPLPSDAVALEDVVRDAVAALPQSERDRVTVFIDAEGTTRGDEPLLTVLVENALENALKFSGTAVVSVRVAELADEVILDVIDRGPGIALEDRQRAFDAFFRTAETRATRLPGHGIGLALVAQVTQMHHGSCEFVDTSVGAQLRVHLPAWRSSVDPLSNV